MRHNDTSPYQACNHKDAKDTKNLIDHPSDAKLAFLSVLCDFVVHLFALFRGYFLKKVLAKQLLTFLLCGLSVLCGKR